MAKKTREELAEIEYRALEEAMREMQALQEAEEPSGIPGAEAATAEPTLEKPKRTRKPRAKKEAASEGEAAAEKPKRTRKPLAKKETASEGEAAAEKPKRTRKPGKKAKKETASEGEAAAEKPKRTRKPGKKAVVPNFVIQNKADNGITYDAVVQKVQDAVAVQEITSLEIYVKAEEGRAYYVVNGGAAGAVELF